MSDFDCTGPGATHHMACACREKQFAERIARLEEVNDLAGRAVMFSLDPGVVEFAAKIRALLAKEDA